MLPRRRRSSPLTALLVALLAVLVLLVVLFRGPLSSLLWRGLGPIVAWRDSLSGGQVAQLKAELASTTAALADRDSLVKENAQLRAELGRAGSSRSIAAAVLTRPPGTPYDTLIIDAGSAEGVAVGAQVHAGAIAIGTIDEVYATASRVVLYSSPGQSYQAMLIASSTSVPVTVEGQGSGSMQARVPAETKVHAGDRVQFPGLSGLMAGTVSGVQGADTDTFKTVYLSLPVNLFDLQLVYVQK